MKIFVVYRWYQIRLSIAFLRMRFVYGANYSAIKQVLIVDLSIKPNSKAMCYVVSPAPLSTRLEQSSGR